jgi:hypothetical protein
VLATTFLNVVILLQFSENSANFDYVKPSELMELLEFVDDDALCTFGHLAFCCMFMQSMFDKHFPLAIQCARRSNIDALLNAFDVFSRFHALSPTFFLLRYVLCFELGVQKCEFVEYAIKFAQGFVKG